MQSTATAVPVVKPCSAATARPSKAVKERVALEVMWFYYRDNKARLSRDIGKHRDAIIEKLKLGIPAEQVFAPFVVAPPSPTVLR
jgi:hypothetical protein